MIPPLKFSPPLYFTVVQVTSEGTLIVPVRRVYQDRPGRGVAAFTAQANAASARSSITARQWASRERGLSSFQKEPPVSEDAYDELPVQGYLFQSVAEDTSDLGRYNGCVCKILNRATRVSEHDVLAMGPAFRVRFGDGREEVAHASELSPWFPTD